MKMSINLPGRKNYNLKATNFQVGGFRNFCTRSNFYFENLNLKYISKNDKKQIMALQIITGNKPLPIPYTSQETVLIKTITIMDKFKSPTLFVFQV